MIITCIIYRPMAARGGNGMYDGPNPDIDWYLRISRAHHVTPRCPFTSVERCPRYYQSLSLLGEAGSTKIPAKEDERLRTLWEKSDLWPVTGEQATSLSGGERKTSFSEFCPEVIYDRFRIFASGLYEHVGEIDRDIAQQRLNRQGVTPTDWRWTWWSIKPMHFTECPVYSPLMHRKPSEEAISEKKPLIDLKPTFMGMSINLNPVLQWIASKVRRS